MLMGVPVAATPGLVPQEEVETVLAEALLDAAVGEAALLVLAAGALDEVVGAALEELELQPARTPSASAATTAPAMRTRPRRGLFMFSAFS
jgi:hypothetical protein